MDNMSALEINSTRSTLWTRRLCPVSLSTVTPHCIAEFVVLWVVIFFFYKFIMKKINYTSWPNRNATGSTARKVALESLGALLRNTKNRAEMRRKTDPMNYVPCLSPNQEFRGVTCGKNANLCTSHHTCRTNKTLHVDCWIRQKEACRPSVDVSSNILLLTPCKTKNGWPTGKGRTWRNWTACQTTRREKKDIIMYGPTANMITEY